MSADKYFTLTEVGEMLKVSRTTLWRWRNERGLKIISIGGVARIRESDLQAFLTQQDANSRPGATQRSHECEN
jgi:excisionase family DNA binding protein